MVLLIQGIISEEYLCTGKKICLTEINYLFLIKIPSSQTKSQQGEVNVWA